MFDSLDNFKGYMESDFRTDTMEPTLAEFGTLATSELCADTSHDCHRRALPPVSCPSAPLLFVVHRSLQQAVTVVRRLNAGADVGNRVYDEL